MERYLLLLVLGLLFGAWALTWWLIYTGEYLGGYTRRRWLVSLLTGWGLLAY